jgi:tagatose-6-phosphate ketose/aldose isomerase
LQSAIASLLSLPEQEKERRGIVHTPHEIAQQPETWAATAKGISANRSVIVSFLEGIGVTADDLRDRPSVILAGAGTSDYIGKAVTRVLRREWNCEVAAIPSTELLTNISDFILPGRKYLMISFSRSGESSEGVATLEHAAALYPDQISHLIVTCNASGAMAKFPGALAIVLDDAVNDRGLAMTSSFTNMVIAGHLLAHILRPAAYETILQEMTAIVARIIPQTADLAAKLAQKGYSRMCFIGAGSLQAAAEESSLKVLELNSGKIATITQSPLGLRHGPLSFVDSNTLLVAYLSSDSQRICYELDLLEEITSKNLAAELVIVAPNMTNRIAGLTPSVLSLDSSAALTDAYRAPVDVILGQMLGLFTSLSNGMRPDSPSSGAIGRVVSHVTIYPVLRPVESAAH